MTARPLFAIALLAACNCSGPNSAAGEGERRRVPHGFDETPSMSSPTSPVAPPRTMPAVGPAPSPPSPRLPAGVFTPPTTADPTVPGVPIVPSVPTDASPESVRAALNATWQFTERGTGPTGQPTVDVCRLVITPDGANETCTLTAPLAPGTIHVCRGTSEPRVRVTTSPYVVLAAAGIVTFTPGDARVISDNACEPEPAGSFTFMQGPWDGSGSSLSLTATSSNGSTSSVTYQRVTRRGPGG